MPDPTPLRVAVVGAGAFGRNHLRVYSELEGATLCAVVDQNSTIAAEAGEKYGIPHFSSVEALLAADLRLDAANICVPTIHHLAAARPLLEAGIDVLIEKPLAPSLADADELIALAARHGCLIQTGHLERFNPAVTAARDLLNRPMFFEAHRMSVFTPRSLDVDVVLDLMIHDLDIVLSLVDSPVHEVRAVGLAVLSPTVDIANVRIEFQNGCVANFTASRVSTERIRKLRFFQPHQYLSIDYARQDLLIIDVAPGENGEQDLAASKPPVQGGEPLLLEISAFLDSVRTRKPPRVTPQQARDSLALALDINREIQAHATRAGLI